MIPVLSEDVCRHLGECCTAVGKAILAIGDDMQKLIEAVGDIVREIAGTISDILPDLVEAVKAIAADDLKEKTKPPRKPVRRLGCRPKTMICNRREFRVQRRC